MKTITKLSFFSLFLTLLIACGGSNEKEFVSEVYEEDAFEEEYVEGMIGISLEEFGLNVQVMVPDENLTGIPVEVVDNQDMGVVEIKAGEKYSFSIALDVADFQLKKDDLETDLLFKNTILEEDSTYIMYRSVLPDESQSFYHFYAGETVGEDTYVIEDLKAGKFTEMNILQMLKSVKSIKPLRES